MTGKGPPKVPENDDMPAPREEDTRDSRLASVVGGAPCGYPAWHRSESLTVDHLRRRVEELLYRGQKEPDQAAPRDGVDEKGGEAENS
jgi:hypothetical protein